MGFDYLQTSSLKLGVWVAIALGSRIGFLFSPIINSPIIFAGLSGIAGLSFLAFFYTQQAKDYQIGQQLKFLKHVSVDINPMLIGLNKNK